MEQDKYGFKFRDWQIYKDSRSLRAEIYKISKSFPKEEMYSLTDQIKRAANSILLNIAEGSNKNSNRDKRLYINRSLGSLNEVVACLDCAVDEGYLTMPGQEMLLEKAASLARQFKAFEQYLIKNQ